jgi:hypothetical protein
MILLSCVPRCRAADTCGGVWQSPVCSVGVQSPHLACHTQ